MSKNIAVMGIYSDGTTASDAINVLLKVGYRPTDISVLASENRGSKDFALEERKKALEGAAIGAAIGAMLGAGIAWFLSVQTVTNLRFEMLTAAGPVVAALAGVGVGGAVGWILGLMTGLSAQEYVAKRYAGRVRHGGILLSVHCDSPEWCERAKKTLKNTGAKNISSAKEASADFGATDKPTERAPVVVTERVETVTPGTAEFPVPTTRTPETIR